MLRILLLLIGANAVYPFVSDVEYLVNPTAAKDIGLGDKPRYRKCSYSKAHGMTGADCANRDLNELPSNLRSNIEILDASYNRIRNIDAISTYSNLRFLYLADNFLQIIEPNTIDQLQKLEVLDLSANGLQTIPRFIFNMPTLRRLYLSNNTFRFETLNDLSYPIKAHLEYINLAYSKMHTMPYFNIMPDLYHLNISGNNFERITIDDLTPLCQLKVLDITNIGVNHINDCDCYQLQIYLDQQSIHVLPDVRHICNYSQTAILKCSELILNSTNLELYNKCMERIRVREKQHQTKLTWAVIAICIASFLILFILILYIIHVLNVKRMKLEDLKHASHQHDVNHTLIKN